MNDIGVTSRPMTKCRHIDLVPISGKPGRYRCANPQCMANYPCVLDCSHADCRVDKGQPLPEWIRLVQKNEGMDNEQQQEELEE